MILPSRQAVIEQQSSKWITRSLATALACGVFSSYTSFAADLSLPIPRPGDQPLVTRMLKDRGEVLPYRLPPADLYLETVQPSTAESIHIKTIRIVGNKQFSVEQLTPILQPYRNRRLSFADITALSNELTQFYFDQGYVNSGALVPDQNVGDGELLIEIVEGQLVDVIVAGLQRLQSDYIKRRLQDQDTEILNVNNLRDRLYLLQLDPLVERVNAQLQPNQRLGEAVLSTRVIEANAFFYNIELNNHKVPSVGEEYASVGIGHRNLLGYADSISVSVGKTEGSEDWQIEYSAPIGYSDLRVGLALSQIDSEVQNDALQDRSIEFKNEFKESSLFVGAPWILTPTEELSWDLKLQIRDSKVTLNDDQFGAVFDEDSLDRATVLRFSQRWIKRSFGQALILQSTFNKGLELFGADNLSGEKPDTHFFSWLGQFQWIRLWGSGTHETLWRGSTQWSKDELISMEKYGTGGRHSNRGFIANQSVRDKGWQSSLEYRYHLNGLFQGLGLKAVGFYDASQAWDTQTDNTGRSSLASIGIGLQGEWLTGEHRWLFELFLAEPVKGKSNSNDSRLQDDGIYLSMRWGTD